MYNKSKRIVKNTALLYVRMLFVMIINLIAVRFILKALGVEDYGIFNVIAGVVTLLSSVSSVLATATQRFYSYDIGNDNTSHLNIIFSSSIVIYLLLSLFVILIGETIGLWFVNFKLVIPNDRLVAANWIYQFSIFSFVFSIIQIPYSSAVIAHEDMGFFAIISTSECVLKFIAAIVLLYIPFDRLIIYGSLLLLISIIIFLSYAYMGIINYSECHFRKPPDKVSYKEMLSFSVWTLFGSLAGVGMIQGNTILVNMFFGPIVNGARAIALQVYSGLTSFSSSFITAIKPQMVKSYAEGDYEYLLKVFYLSNKLIYYCLLMIGIPLILEMRTVLDVWLNSTSANSILFSQIIVVYCIIMALNNPITIIMQATGFVKQYFVPVETITLLCLPMTYVLFKMGYPAYTTFYAMIVVAVAAHFVRILCLKKYFCYFSIQKYTLSFIIPAVFITLIAYLFCLFIHLHVSSMALRFFGVLSSSCLIIIILTYLFGLDKKERVSFNNLIRSTYNNLF